MVTRPTLQCYSFMFEFHVTALIVIYITVRLLVFM